VRPRDSANLPSPERYRNKDEKYSTILVNRRHEDESVKMKREAEDNLLRDIEKMIEDKELTSDQKILRGTQN
jgi:hypothetical protein